MNREELASWAAREWIKQAVKRTPLARSIRNAKAQDRGLRQEYKKRMRSLASQNGARMRLLKKQQVEDAEVLLEKRVAQDAERERQLLDFLILHG